MFEKHAPFKLLPFLMVLNAHSENNYIVGGAVRDLLSGKVPNDYDLVTDTPIAELAEHFLAGGFTAKLTGANFLVLNVYLDGYEVEIANFRKESEHDGRHAVCEVGTIEDDAFRRDFTINALFMNTKTGEVVDPTGQGLADVEAGIVRFVGKAKERIREDYLRVWRAFRLQNKLGFVFEKRTERALRENFIEAYQNSNPQRVLQELIKLSEQ